MDAGGEGHGPIAQANMGGKYTQCFPELGHTNLLKVSHPPLCVGDRETEIQRGTQNFSIRARI